jgi:lipoate-protein ligase A
MAEGFSALPSPAAAPLPEFTRWLPTSRRGGIWQMAIDAWLLEQGRPALRLYRWQRPCVSVGRNLRRLPPAWLRLATSGAIELVRRPSGGGAVLHGGDLTYALVWPQAPGSRPAAYRLACRWLQEAFATLGQPLRFGDRPAALAVASCFASRTVADLVHRDQAKRIGSAQLWRAGCLLQHGSIQLAPDAALWRRLFAQEPPSLAPLPVGDGELEAVLIAAADRWLPLPPLRQVEITANELAGLAARLDQWRIDASVRPGGGSTSPEASIERTTCGSASPRG